MLQVKKRSSGPLKISRVRSAKDEEHIPAGTACALEAGDRQDKPPC